MNPPRKLKLTAGLAAVMLVAAGATAGSSAADSPSRPDAAGRVDPALFTDPQPNKYFPLEPGTVSRLKGTDGGLRLREAVRVTHRTKRIQGVDTTVVTDVVRRADGSLAERTEDWYSNDNSGNVWYFGERTATYDRSGNVESREGSWRAGRDGAVAGFIMPADPRPTDAYRQEFYPGHAEDQAWLVQGDARVRTPMGRSRHVVRSFEWTRLEPGVMSMKFYAPGLGIVLEKDVSGGQERFELVSVRHRS